MTRKDFLRFVHLKLPQLYKICKAVTANDVMNLKRELQVAMTGYSKNKNGQLDNIQEKALAMMMKMEKWIMHAFIAKEMKYMERNFPNMSAMGRKSMAKEAWEKYNREMSY